MLILGVISFFTAYDCVEAYGDIECFRSEECGWFCCCYLPIPTCLLGLYHKSSMQILTPSGLFMLLIESYLLSCLLVWIYDKTTYKSRYLLSQIFSCRIVF